MNRKTNIVSGIIVSSAFIFLPLLAGAQLGVNLTGSSETTAIESSTMIDLDANTLVEVEAPLVEVRSSAQVNSQADLEAFSLNVTSNDKAVAKVVIAKDKPEVEVVYRHHGKFLGFIPVTIKSTTMVEVKSDTEVYVNSNISWWGFLVAKENYAEENVESRIANNKVLMANTNVNISAQAKAQIAEAMIAEIEAVAEAQAIVNN